MYRKCTTELSARHQRQVEQCLLELMRRQPYEEISVTQLCQTSGVSRRIFYHLFNNKTDALHALIDHTIQDLESFLPERAQDVLRFFLYWREQKPLLDALWGNGLLPLLPERLIIHALNEDFDYLYWLNTNGWEDQQEVVTFNLCGIMGLLCQWYASGFRKSPEEMAALLTRMMTTPLARENSEKE